MRTPRRASRWSVRPAERLLHGHQRRQRLRHRRRRAHRRADLFRSAGRRDRRPARPDRFDQGINRVTWLLIRFMLVMVPLVFLINGLTKHDWLEAFLFAVAVAVGLTPEMLPMIVTVNLAKGAIAMSRAQGDRQAAQRHPELRRDGRALHRQDRHADPGPHHSANAALDIRGEDYEARSAIRLSQQPFPDRPEEPARQGRARARRPAHRSLASTTAMQRSTRSRSTSPAGACRSWSRMGTTEAPAHLQGRGRGDPRGLPPGPDRRREGPLDREPCADGAWKSTIALNEDGLRVIAVAYKEVDSPTSGVWRRRRGRPDAARLYRLPRSAQGNRRAGDRRARRATASRSRSSPATTRW